MSNTTSFSRFRELPAEIREMIWEAAVRPTEPGVHNFRLRKTGSQDANESEDEVFFPLAYSSDKCHYRMALQKNDKSSTCRLDGGLWTACWESRIVMEKAYQSRAWIDYHQARWPKENRTRTTVQDIRIQPPEKSSKGKWPMQMPFTGSTPSGNKYFTVLPSHDLFIINFREMMNFRNLEDRPFWQQIRRLAIQFDNKNCFTRFSCYAYIRPFVVCCGVQELFIIDPGIQPVLEFMDDDAELDRVIGGSGERIFRSTTSQYTEVLPDGVLNCETKCLLTVQRFVWDDRGQRKVVKWTRGEKGTPLIGAWELARRWNSEIRWFRRDGFGDGATCSVLAVVDGC